MAFDSDIEQALKTNREPPDELNEIEEQISKGISLKENYTKKGIILKQQGKF